MNTGLVSPPLKVKDYARVRSWLQHFGCGWTTTTILYCAWWQQASAFWMTVGAAGFLWLLDFGPPRVRSGSRLLQGGLLAWRIADFYRLRGVVENNSLIQHLLLVALVFGSLYYLLLCGLSWLRAQPDRLPKLAFASGTVLIGVLSVDLFFTGRVPLQPLRPPSYHPYLAFSVRDSYAFTNARERFVKDTRGVDFQQKKESGVVRIVLSGASTMYDHIPQTLETELRRRYPRRRFEILTTCYPGKYQLNELVDTTVCIPHWEPDLVISINGFNEIWFGEDDNFYEGMPYFEGQMRTVGTVPMLLARFSHFGANQFARDTAEFHSHSPYRLRQPLEYEPPRYFSYLRLTARTLQSFGIPYVHMFCPNVAERENRTLEEEEFLAKDGAWKQRVTGRRAESERIVLEEGQTSYPVMSLLNSCAEQVFRDECHLNERGYRLVSEDLAQRIPGWLGWTE